MSVTLEISTYSETLLRHWWKHSSHTY